MWSTGSVEVGWGGGGDGLLAVSFDREVCSPIGRIRAPASRVQLGDLRLLQGLSKGFPVRGIRNGRQAVVERLKKLPIVLVGRRPPGDNHGARSGRQPCACHPHPSTARKNRIVAGIASV